MRNATGADRSPGQILGGAIVVTVLLGCSKLGYTHWKSSTLPPEKERIEQALQRQMSQRRRAGSDVPFGIRAIESGIEVEGVWISRPTTPEGTRHSSPSRDHGPRKDFEIDIESQKTIASSSTLVRSVSRSNPPSREASPDFHKTKPIRSKHPPLAYSKYTGNPALQQASTMGTLQGLEAIYKASGPMAAADASDMSTAREGLASSESSYKSGTDSDPISSSAPRLLNSSSQRTRQQSADLDLRRMSQAAETGQLTPRVKREHARKTHESGDYYDPPRRNPAPPLDDSPTGMWSPQLDHLPPSMRRFSLPDVTPFTEFCLTAPASPLSRPESDAGSISSTSSSSSTSRPSTAERSTRSISTTTTTTTTKPLISAKISSSPAILLPPPSSSFERRDSQILRGHGTGFEILQPGTLPMTHPIDSKRRGAPPISVHNNTERSRPNSADGTHRKLQKKKRRPSIESDTSSRDDGSSIA